ncbi:Tryptophan or tyrosine transporter protein [Klebsormidium nitens]|uniref:Tryptophan or tyrosine transporter protein n=1 Tax=Klebsormidium nitens TaxID=105231 RepID=A0A1Y1HMD4_KLENI|nr:Tryptophan or tyrosine transporter protein [Klebsormidium nitens]|eukprot:GAQ79764.1 Tryptophan or tyrosine transporter protein [Klebsormidium nitens]
MQRSAWPGKDRPRAMGRNGVTEKEQDIELAVRDTAPSRSNPTVTEAENDASTSEIDQLIESSDGKSEKAEGRSVSARLWSNVNGGTLRHEPGSLVGAILLVAGTTVGAGILAIPAVTQDAGFLASAFACVGCWAYMATTGILVAEVNINTMCELGSGGVSLVSMAERTLGKAGVRVAVGTYIFIHYALLVAYVARSGDIITNFTGLPLPVSAAAFTAAFGAITYFSSQKTLGYVNGFLIAAILASFATLVGIAAPEVEPASLLKANWSAVPASIPIVALSFVYQNVVPVISSELEGDLPKIRTAIMYGTAIPLTMFLLWDAVILGSVPAAVPGAAQSMAAMDPLLRLRESSGAVGPAVEIFSFFAIGTSFIGFVLGLSDFLADLLKLPSGQEKRRPLPYLLTLIPPYALALTNPEIFYKALDFAGAYGVLVLFGLFPGAMAWAERYTDACMTPAVKPIIPGGKVTLSLIMGAAGIVIAGEFVKDVAGFLQVH